MRDPQLAFQIRHPRVEVWITRWRLRALAQLYHARVCGLDLLEALLGRLRAVVVVRVVELDQPAVGRAHIGVARAAADAEDLVWIAVGHGLEA